MTSMIKRAAAIDQSGHDLASVDLRSERRAVLAAMDAHGIDIRTYAKPDVKHAVIWVTGCWAGVASVSFYIVNGIPGIIPGYSLFTVFIGFVAFGLLQHAMLNTMHEASHGCLLPNRRWNNLIGNWLVAIPIGITIDRYRTSHSEHHNALGTKADPSRFVTESTLTGWPLARTILSLLFGRMLLDLVLNAATGKRGMYEVSKRSAEKAARQDRQRLLLAVPFHSIVLIVLYLNGYALIWGIWFLSLVTLVPFLDALRTVAEHRGGHLENHEFHTRNHHSNRVLSQILAPNFLYHWEHHLFPGVPQHQLAELNAKLIELGFERAKPAKGGFFGALATGFSS